MISAHLFDNIRETIGCDYELIVIDNSANKFSIFEAYNLGIKKSIGKFLCFIHDDIFIHTIGWGRVLLRIFEDDNVGLIGVAGAKIKSKTPSAWWDCPENHKVINIIQHFKHKKKEIWNFGFENKQKIEVVAIDGVFMIMRKDKRIKFDSNMEGFHNYDLNISFEFKKLGFVIIVSKEILIEHFSLGTINIAWIDSTYKIHQKYKDFLPIVVGEHYEKKNETVNAKKFINECCRHKKYTIAIHIWIKLFLLNPISKYHYHFWKKILKKSICLL